MKGDIFWGSGWNDLLKHLCPLISQKHKWTLEGVSKITFMEFNSACTMKSASMFLTKCLWGRNHWEPNLFSINNNETALFGSPGSQIPQHKNQYFNFNQTNGRKSVTVSPSLHQVLCSLWVFTMLQIDEAPPFPSDVIPLSPPLSICGSSSPWASSPPPGGPYWADTADRSRQERGEVVYQEAGGGPPEPKCPSSVCICEDRSH